MGSNDQIAYFLGVEGEQSGPYSFSDLLSQISSGALNPDTLIWWEGQSDWQIISSLPEFQKLFNTPEKNPTQPSLKSRSPQKKAPISIAPPAWIATYQKPGNGPVPIYSKKEGSFGPATIIPVKWSLALIGAGIIGLLIWGWGAPVSPKEEPSISQVKPSAKESEASNRQLEFDSASTSILFDPLKSVPVLSKLVEQDPDDAVGKESFKVLSEYFEKNSEYRNWGNLYLKMKQPEKAAEIFLKDPKLSAEAEKALFASFENSSGQKKANFLIQDIKLLLNPIQNYPLASERIALFEKTFPDLSHPFSYYLMNSVEKIKQIFPKVASVFSQTLFDQMEKEFPQITLPSKPKVELKRDAANRWRMIGSYRGDILIRTDRIRKIYFIYWFMDNNWLLVDTNLTPERSRFASEVRKTNQGSAMSAEVLLDILEKIFKQQYPSLGVHEKVGPDLSPP